MTRIRAGHEAQSPTSLPIRTHCVLGASGVRSVALRVFCPRRVATTSVDVCERCPRREAIHVGGDCPRVICYPGPEQGAQEVAGELVRSTVLCVLSDLPLDDLGVDDRAAAEIIPVVDESHRYIGGIVQGRSSSAPPPRESDTALLRGHATVEDAMEHVLTVNERDDVVTAAAAMTSSRARCVAVVNDDGVVVGLLDDIALLASVARAHAASEILSRCRCGRVYSRRQRSSLAGVGSIASNDSGQMELRSCETCGRAMAVAELVTVTPSWRE